MLNKITELSLMVDLFNIAIFPEHQHSEHFMVILSDEIREASSALQFPFIAVLMKSEVKY